MGAIPLTAGGDSQPTCNNCGSSAYRVLYPAGRAQVNQIVRCSACGLMYAYPLHRANLAGYDIAVGSRAPLTAEDSEVRRGADKLPDYEKIEGVLRGYLARPGHVIEVGSSSGILLDSFRRAGWRVTGIEPDGRAVEYARSRYGLDVHQGTLDSAALEPGIADAVVMLHVIEHVDDPAHAVSQVGRLLRPGGIFVVETPTYDSLTYALLRHRERSLSCNGHIFFYTEASLTKLLGDSGFEILRSQRVGRTLTIARLLWNLGVISKSARVQSSLARFSERWSLSRRHLYLNARDMIRVYARKREASTGGGSRAAL